MKASSFFFSLSKLVMVFIKIGANASFSFKMFLWWFSNFYLVARCGGIRKKRTSQNAGLQIIASSKLSTSCCDNRHYYFEVEFIFILNSSILMMNTQTVKLLFERWTDRNRREATSFVLIHDKDKKIHPSLAMHFSRRL